MIPGGRLSLSFSPNARYLAVLDSAQNRMLWIWDVTHFSLAAVLVHLSAIKGDAFFSVGKLSARDYSFII